MEPLAIIAFLLFLIIGGAYILGRRKVKSKWVINEKNWDYSQKQKEKANTLFSALYSNDKKPYSSKIDETLSDDSIRDPDQNQIDEKEDKERAL